MENIIGLFLYTLRIDDPLCDIDFAYNRAYKRCAERLNVQKLISCKVASKI